MGNELVNNDTFKREDCGEIDQAFASGGRTKFCTNCGSREIEGFEEEE
jgi:hypothetical protein